jgi:hypothetical protein
MVGFLKALDTPAGRTIGIIREDGVAEDCTVVSTGEVSGAALPQTFWVSPGSVGSLQDGSAANPFLTPQAAMDQLELLALPGVLLLAEGDYTALNLVVSSQSVAVYGFGVGAGLPFLNSVTVSGGVVASFEQLGGVTFSGTLATLSFFRTQFLGQSFADANIVRFEESSGAFNVAGGANSLQAFNSTVGSVGTFGLPFSFARIRECAVSGDVLATAVELRGSSVAGVVTADTLQAEQSSLTAAAGVQVATSSTLDAFSLQSIRNAGGVSVLGALTISDRPFAAAVAIVVPPLAGAMADVTVALAGAKPGDTFALASSTRLAGVGVVDAWSPGAGQLTVRFFGTTGGGATAWDVSQFTNSA